MLVRVKSNYKHLNLQLHTHIQAPGIEAGLRNVQPTQPAKAAAAAAPQMTMEHTPLLGSSKCPYTRTTTYI